MKKQLTIAISLFFISLGYAFAQEPDFTGRLTQMREQTTEVCDETSEFTVWVFGGVNQQGQRICLPGLPSGESKQPNYAVIKKDVMQLEKQHEQARLRYSDDKSPEALKALESTEKQLGNALRRREAIELQAGPQFFSRVLADAKGFQNPYGEFDQIFLYDITPTISGNIVTVKPLKRRVFDYTDMEFQWLGFKRSLQKNQTVKTEIAREYVVFIDTPADNAWIELVNKALGIGITIGALFAGGALAR